MVTIGHASLSENGTINGQKGDQNGKEVFTRPYYVHPSGWAYVLRPFSDIAEKLAVSCERACENQNIGYSQDTRNSLHTEAQRAKYDLSAITVPCNCDCSSFVTVCAIAAGVKSLEYVGNAPTTATMKDAFLKTGKFKIITDSDYLTGSDYLERGDILVSPNHHTVIVLSNGVKVKKKDVQTIALEVLADMWGKGQERKQRLERAGYNYREVQDAVNLIIGTPAVHVDKKGIDLIKQFESCRLTAYKLAGETQYTIGWGHRGADVLPNMTISQEMADEMLRLDLVKYENYVKKYVTDIVLTQNRLNALTSYCYNRGAGGMKQLADASHTVDEYAENIVKYWGKAVRYKNGLVRRRKAEQALFLS